MARTAPVPNIPAIPGMNPGVFVMGGGGGSGGSGGRGGNGAGNGQGGSGSNGGDGADGGGKGAGSCGTGSTNGGGCPNHQRRGSLRILSFDGVEHDIGKVPPGTGIIGPHGWIIHREGAGFRLDLPDGQHLFFGEHAEWRVDL
ncbi:hypothetical protein [Sorangium sp. So ce1000]|uniref:hypothetical protein n=1 Tax=Sorangium sp. So ce1000 TaxID=3133325 RepID=UPI003F5E7903